MKKILMQVFVVACVLAFAAPPRALAQVATFTEPLSQISFPLSDTVVFNGSTHILKATGAAEKRRAKPGNNKSGSSYREICTVAHYMENPPSGTWQNIYGLILQSTNAKAFVINFNQRIPAGKIRGWFSSQAEKGDAAALKKVRPNLQEFLDLLAGEQQENERYVIRWLPDGNTLVVRPDATEMLIENAAFAPFWWKIWLGEKSQFERADFVNRIVSL